MRALNLIAAEDVIIKKLICFLILICSLITSVNYYTYPQEIIGQLLILRNEESFDQFEELMLSREKLESVQCSREKVAFFPFKDQLKNQDLFKQIYFEDDINQLFISLCHNINLNWARKKNNDIFFYYGSGSGNSYLVGVVNLLKNKNRNKCPRFASITLYESCIIKVTDKWGLHYTKWDGV